MAEGEIRRYFVPIGDTLHPHPKGVCPEALAWRDRLLRELDKKEGICHEGICTPLFPGMPFEREEDKLRAGYPTGVCAIRIKSTGIKNEKVEYLPGE